MIPPLLTTHSRSHWTMVLLLSVSLLSSGCAGSHFNITREIGLFPPLIENRSDFYEAAKTRCIEEAPGIRNKMLENDCIRYWETVLWAQDYRSYARARAILNRDIIYLGGVVALASVGALAGFSALGHTSSDAYVIIPIVGTFLSGLLAYSKNDALYEAYEVAGMKIEQALRSAANQSAPNTATAYREATSALRLQVGSAIDQLTRKKIDIVKFQSKSEADQFRVVSEASAERELGVFRLLNNARTDTTTNPPKDPTKVIVTLNSPLDPQNVPTNELRLKLSATANGDTFILRVSSVTGADVVADLPAELLNHGPRTYRVELQARNGEYTIKDSSSVTLEFSKVRLDIKVNGPGSVRYSDANGNSVSCPPVCDTGLIPKNSTTDLTATPTTPGSTTFTWTKAPATCSATVSPCAITKPQDDTAVEITFSP
jgi:hypothetical protein